MARFLEIVYQEHAPKIDEDSGVLKDVKLLGVESRNGRKYTRHAIENAVGLYEGRKVYIDHPRPSDTGTDRSYDRWAGTIQSSRVREDGIYGDVKLRRKAAYFEGIIEAAREFPRDIGLSHVADGQSRLDGDTEIVESISEVFSVDLVTDPATTAGIFESRNPMKKKTKTAKQIAEDAPESTPRRTLLIEQLDDGAVPADMAVEVAEEPDPAEEVKAALEKAAVAVIRKVFNGDIELAAGLAEIKKIIGMKEEAAPEESSSEPPAEPTAESRKLQQQVTLLERQLNEQQAKSMLLESGREASEPRIKALAAADKADRKSLLESWPQKEPEPGRPSYSPGLVESEGSTEFSDDPEKFAASYR